MIRAAIIPTAPLLAVVAQPAMADWGGVAVNAKTGHYGYSVRWDNRSDAGARAMEYCRQFSNNVDGCEVVMTTTRCGGVARGFENFAPKLFVVEAASRETAAGQALSDCQEAVGSSCTLERSFCAEDQ